MGKSGHAQHSTTRSPPPPTGVHSTVTTLPRCPCITCALSIASILRASAVATMDVVAAVSGYISKMVTAGESASGSSSTKMKILLLDSETVGNTARKRAFGTAS